MLRDCYQFPIVSERTLSIRKRPSSKKIESVSLLGKEAFQTAAITFVELEKSTQRRNQLIANIGYAPIKRGVAGRKLGLHQCNVIDE